MKRQIRKNAFETNSSSIHSIVIKYNGQYRFELCCDDKDKFTVVAKCHDYSNAGKGDDEYIISTQQQKLEYLISWLVCRNQYEYGEDLYDNSLYNSILVAIQKVNPQIQSIRNMDSDKAEFNHQTAPYSYSDCVVNVYNEDDICNFIFNDNIELHCWFD